MRGRLSTRLAAGLGGLLLAWTLASPAQATAGYFALGYSAAQRGAAGAGIAYGYDAMSATTNPAGAASVGPSVTWGMQAFVPKRGYEGTSTGFVPSGTVMSDRSFFIVPNFAYNRPLANGTVLNFAAYGNGGMNTTYRIGLGGCGSVYCGGPAGVDLTQLFLSVTYAGKAGNLSWGISPTLAVQRFASEGLGAFAGISVSPGNLTDRGHQLSTGAGLRAGMIYDVSQQLSLGVSLQSKMRMSAFSKYSGLFADGGRFDIPAVAGLGLAYKPNEALTVMFDVQRIYYSGVGAVSNATNAGPLGAPGGAGFGWKDVTVAKLGMAWKSSPSMIWRAGYAYATNPIGPEDVTLNILAPGVVKHHFTFGGTRKMSDRSSLDFAVEYAPQSSVSGPETTPSGPTGGTVRIFMHQIGVSIGWTTTF